MTGCEKIRQLGLGLLEPQPVASANPVVRKEKANAEFLSEMIRVVTLGEPQDFKDFRDLHDALNLGASYEGVYNGLSHSGVYRQLEASNPQSSAESLRFFCDELMLLENELPEPTQFEPSAAKPLSAPVWPTEVVEGEEGNQPAEDPSRVKQIVFGKAKTAPPPASTCLEIFQGASFFTLKRVIGEEALKVIQVKATQSQALAEWYGPWVKRMAGYKVDFGLKERNQADEAFHAGWSKSVPTDLLRWEVLNRYHRIINATK